MARRGKAAPSVGARSAAGRARLEAGFSFAKSLARRAEQTRNKILSYSPHSGISNRSCSQTTDKDPRT